MANEAVIIELLGNKGDPVRFTCDSGTAITKGTIMKLTDPRTASANAGANDVIAGIAASDKSASDGDTSIACYTKGIFDLTVAPGGTVAIGQSVATSGANLIKAASATDRENGKVLGKSLEAGSSSEVIAVLVEVV